MFESLQNKLNEAFRSLTGKAVLSESNMRDGLAMIQNALLEADAGYDAVKAFMERIHDKALGEKVLKSLRPSDQLVKIVHEELVNFMGPVDNSLHLKRSGVSVIMMCGLQGSGKTTTTGKLARMLKIRGRRPMLVAADLQRPAAVKQLQVLGEQLGVPVYAEEGQQNPVKVCNDAVAFAEKSDCDILILDTAGRLHIDEALMDELKRIESQCRPDQVYLVVDSMTGQDAVVSAKAFNEALQLDGVILTKLDGDARGGAALSMKHISGAPIKFMGVGEQMDALEEFHPDRMAGRILGMGDILTLVETAQREFDQDEMRLQEERMKKGEFTFDDFRKMMNQTRRLGPLGKIIGMIPGMGMLKQMMDMDAAEGEMKKLGGIIDSMTAKERNNPSLIDNNRKRRIAAGAGVGVNEVGEICKQFDAMASIMKKMAGLGMGGKMQAMQELTRQMTTNPQARLAKQKGNTGKRLTPAERERQRKQLARELKKNKKGKQEQ